jgi:hypothetical protein
MLRTLSTGGPRLMRSWVTASGLWAAQSISSQRTQRTMWPDSPVTGSMAMGATSQRPATAKSQRGWK